ncbi:PilW family protein [Pseudomonas sp. BN102]|uniref:PilW family protein n=1 Tax=Pseudomonas sp. BN102 TaxID=2567886 RepID=UPI002454A748|nr:PilW family protein [Pseudomonas sp. BN102]MDH4611118.1 prepilin-type N-terminal cleavage/methylation domain-containing protein [Pseudomonas sp. BN102]
MNDKNVPIRGIASEGCGRGRQSGFSLVELMIAATISLLIMAAVLTLFLDVSRTNDEMARTNAQIENGRFALQLLQEDLAHAGFWDGYVPEFDDLSKSAVPSDVPTVVPGPCSWSAADNTNLMGISVQAYDDVPPGCNTIVTNKKANTDVLVIRHAETCRPGVGNCEAEVAGKLYFQPSFCATDPARYVLGTSGFTMKKRNCTTLSEKRKFVSNIYYVRDFSVTAGDGIPTLMRSTFGAGAAPEAAESLIEGIEGFRVELGLDNVGDGGVANDYTAAVSFALDTNGEADRSRPTNRGNGAADGNFVRCPAAGCTVSQLIDVVAVKVFLLVRGIQPSPGYSDGKTYALGLADPAAEIVGSNYKRHVYSTTARLVNVSGRRETP